jgi:hypothetical protein
MWEPERDKVSSKSPKSKSSRQRRRGVADFTEEVPDEDGLRITIPEGCIGELRCTFKAGCDCMGFIYGRPDSSEVHVIGNCHDGTQTGDEARHRFSSGFWNLWVYNKTMTRFERILKKDVRLEDGSESFILGATHRISETNKTCIVCVMDVVPEKR